MQRAQMIKAIESAKETHLNQMDKIFSVIKGEEVENPTPVNKMECECGVWFHDSANMMKEILGAQLYERLDKLHEKWHIEYLNIYNLFFVEGKKGIWTKILNLAGGNDMKRDKAKLYYSELQETTKEILTLSDSALRRINALNKSKFE